ncbi:sensor histidine kinase [Lentilactobacillus parafarraginis]|uniref:sensor histidine kinase n=1 Tax=Lentilactobacillus parafarraginis TaxID=390842 RepID=UPI0006D15238|nr:sensor histidine kinase [Lentilactobacillus parafarraginis]
MITQLRNRIKLHWTAYVWLIYLPFALMDYLPPKSFMDWFWLFMGGCFLVTFIIQTESRNKRIETLSAISEFTIAAIFVLFASNFAVIIFPAWTLTWILLYRSKKHLWAAGISFYLVMALGVLITFIRYPNAFSHATLYLNLIFPLVSPVFSYSIYRAGKRNTDLLQANQRLESVIKQDERQRIARDLHDTLGQSFSMITIKSELAKKLLEKQPDKVDAELDDITTTSRENLQLVRNIINNLRQETIGETMLKQAQNLQNANIHLETTGEEAATAWPTNVQVPIGQILQEAITNVIRHSHATSVTITFLELADSNYRVDIQDNGTGNHYQRQGSHGVSGMAERISADGGTFSIQSNSIGTLVSATIPNKGAVQ